MWNVGNILNVEQEKKELVGIWWGRTMRTSWTSVRKTRRKDDRLEGFEELHVSAVTKASWCSEEWSIYLDGWICLWKARECRESSWRVGNAIEHEREEIMKEKEGEERDEIDRDWRRESDDWMKRGRKKILYSFWSNLEWLVWRKVFECRERAIDVGLNEETRRLFKRWLGRRLRG